MSLSVHFGETPIHFLYTDEQGNRLWVKREDLLPYSFGGNKARIGLELMTDMKRKGGNHMIAYGNARSNLCRVLSNLCVGEGFPCTILSPADDDGERTESFNERLCRQFGAEIVPCLKTGVKETVEAALRESESRGLKPYYIYGNALGTGNLETPVRAYRKVWPEILHQQTAQGIVFDAIYLACGTGMTQAGLMVGKELDGGAARIIGVSIARSAQIAAAHIGDYGKAFLGRALKEAACVRDDYALNYGQYTPAMADCVRTIMTRYGLPLDLTYTGKAFYGMLEEIKRLGLRNQNLLFIHTGGTPLFFDTAASVFKI